MPDARTSIDVISIFSTVSYFIFAQISQMADDTGLDFSDQINALEGKYQQVPDIGNLWSYLVVTHL